MNESNKDTAPHPSWQCFSPLNTIKESAKGKAAHSFMQLVLTKRFVGAATDKHNLKCFCNNRNIPASPLLCLLPSGIIFSHKHTQIIFTCLVSPTLVPSLLTNRNLNPVLLSLNAVSCFLPPRSCLQGSPVSPPVTGSLSPPRHQLPTSNHLGWVATPPLSWTFQAE